MVPKTVSYKKAKAAAAVAQARLRGEPAADDRPPTSSSTIVPIVNGMNGDITSHLIARSRDDDPNDQLELEMRQRAGGGEERQNGREHEDDDVTMEE